ncbi:MAG: M20 family metallo-hydrolase [Bacteroidales bacterium]|nr:M20 family metallo-hydrolase [Bacteroidales bacterium]
MDKDHLYYHAVDLLKDIITIPSFSREEQSVADKLEEYISRQNFTPNRIGNNIWIEASAHDANRPTLLLNSHIDTVKPVAGWNKDPFKPVENDDYIYGLGSNDAGASLVSLLHSFFLLSRKEQPYNLIFLASSEEEISGKNGIESALRILPSINFAVVGEPTGMQPAIAEKGLMVLDCIANGKSGHAARNEGVNAIYEAIQDIEWFRSHHFPKISPLLGEVKMSVTMINAGTQHNVIPDECRYVVDVRSNEYYNNEELFLLISQSVKSTVQARSFRLNSSGIQPNHPFVKRALLLGLLPFGSPTLSDQALMPFPSVKMGPGDSSRSHTADEYIKKSEIREAIEIYTKLLDDLTL